MPVTFAEAVDLVRRLEVELTSRRLDMELTNDYYVGRHPLAFASAKFRDAFGGLFGAFADNWCEIVCDAPQERMRILGFRFGDEDGVADQDANRFWQSNYLDADSDLLHTEMFVRGRAFALVWADEDDENEPEITVESPLECIVGYEPGNRRRRRAGLKVWQQDEFQWANLYLPDEVWKLQRRGSGSTGGAFGANWSIRPTGNQPNPMPNPLGKVPLVEFANKGRLTDPPMAEHAKVIPLQDAVNKIVSDMLVASEFGAYPQRYITGLTELPDDPESAALAEFKAAASRVWLMGEGQPGQFAATDLGNFVGASEQLVKHIASQSKTPQHYFYLSGQFPSGESILSAESGLTAKVQSRTRAISEAWEEVIRLAFAVAGDERRARIKDAETLWSDPQFRTESAHADAVIKQFQVGILTKRQAREEMGLSPQVIRRMEQEERTGALLNAAANLQLVPAQGGDGGDVPPADAA